MTFDPKSVKVTCATLPKDNCAQVLWKYIQVCGYSDPFYKNLNQRSLTLDDLWPHICWGHVCDSTQGSLSPSFMEMHQCMWIQWSILQNTTYYIHTTYIHTTYIHTYYIHKYSIQGRVKKSLQPSFFSSHGCIYTKVAVSASSKNLCLSSMNLCLSYHVTWTVLHTWLHYNICINTMHFGHCL